MIQRLKAWFQSKDDLIEEVERWRRRAIIHQEHTEYWQESSKFYRKKWNEALSFLPQEKAEELSNNNTNSHA